MCKQTVVTSVVMLAVAVKPTEVTSVVMYMLVIAVYLTPTYKPYSSIEISAYQLILDTAIAYLHYTLVREGIMHDLPFNHFHMPL